MRVSLIGGTDYSLSEVLKLADQELGRTYLNFAATSKESVKRGVADLAMLVKNHCGVALSGDDKFFEALEQARAQWAKEYALEVQVEHVRPKAEKAFRDGDYAGAVKLYSKIQSRLRPSELKKLQISIERSKRYLRPH
ncbi:MAG: hypothetical protein DHS20C11_34060 [Lysobacteraceae bacterium]|nr:MAG: hypothetical protein DHS20C11_34060 [Xanthomonadaceae bacterium]